MLTLLALNRWQAAGIHLGLSATIGTLVLAAMLLVWYPGAYFAAAGGEGLLLILLGVDITLGPLLTLVIFNPRKRLNLIRLDLSVIAALQLAALLYGVGVMFAARPVYLVFVVDIFEVVSAPQIDPDELAKAARPFDTLPITGPRVVGALKPKDRKEAERIMFLEVGGRSLAEFPQHYVAYSETAPAAAKKSRPLEALRRKDPTSGRALDGVVRTSGRSEDSLRYVPVKARFADLAAIVTIEGEYVDLIVANGW